MRMARLLSFLLALLVIIAINRNDSPWIYQMMKWLSTGFTGTELLLFGATEGHGDIVVTVVGPRSDEVVWRKEKWQGSGSAAILLLSTARLPII